MLSTLCYCICSYPTCNRTHKKNAHNSNKVVLKKMIEFIETKHFKCNETECYGISYCGMLCYLLLLIQHALTNPLISKGCSLKKEENKKQKERKMDDSLVKISSRSAAGKTLSEQIEKERELQKRMANKLELKKKFC